MPVSVEFKKKKQSPLEKFGVYYLGVFGKRDLNYIMFLILVMRNLSKKINRISNKGIFLSALVGLMYVF